MDALHRQSRVALTTAPQIRRGRPAARISAPIQLPALATGPLGDRLRGVRCGNRVACRRRTAPARRQHHAEGRTQNGDFEEPGVHRTAIIPITLKVRIRSDRASRLINVLSRGLPIVGADCKRLSRRNIYIDSGIETAKVTPRHKQQNSPHKPDERPNSLISHSGRSPPPVRTGLVRWFLALAKCQGARASDRGDPSGSAWRSDPSPAAAKPCGQ